MTNQDKTHTLNVRIELPGKKPEPGINYTAAKTLRSWANHGSHQGTASYHKRSGEIVYQGTHAPEEVLAELTSLGYRIISHTSSQPISEENTALLSEMNRLADDNRTLSDENRILSEQQEISTTRIRSLEESLAQKPTLQEYELGNQRKKPQKAVPVQEIHSLPPGMSFDQAVMWAYMNTEVTKILDLGPAFGELEARTPITVPYSDTLKGEELISNMNNMLRLLDENTPLYKQTKEFHEQTLLQLQQSYDVMISEQTEEFQESLRDFFAGQKVALLYAEQKCDALLTLPILVADQSENVLGQRIDGYVQDVLTTLASKKQVAFEQVANEGLVAYSIHSCKPGLAYVLEHALNNGQNHPLRKAGLSFRVGPLGQIVPKAPSLEEKVQLQVSGSAQTTPETLPSQSTDVRTQYVVPGMPRVQESTIRVYQTVVDVISGSPEVISADKLSDRVHELLDDYEINVGQHLQRMKNLGLIESTGRRQGYVIGPKLR